MVNNHPTASEETKRATENLPKQTPSLLSIDRAKKFQRQLTLELFHIVGHDKIRGRGQQSSVLQVLKTCYRHFPSR
ncbi:hypothetical protein BVE84_03640 [Streptococcus azizii]|uniref:Uncharacterized protein n=1 Tax=Streptococcus azizii TaxID=1579424 RepID=A0AB36JU15_9STRE|nr:hypothetical protein BVE85_10110 [Streptococcus azizii]ONK28384.1 hypothetical protein BVE86_03290 [Streptococcus azizii]ONK30165.1 hypothetical protein BVE84_03640 [Streptococcus azizii]